MSRLNTNIKTDKDKFLEYWKEPYYYGFSSWKEYLDISLEFFNKEFESYKNKIEEFDKIHKGKFIEVDDGLGDVYTIDGMDVYGDNTIALTKSYEKVFPLILIGIYTDFESTLKGICEKVDKIKSNLKPLKGKYIFDCKTHLCSTKSINLIFSITLNTQWDKIDKYRELRNLFAHDDNPIDISNTNSRLNIVKGIKDITVTKNNFVSFDNEKPLLDFIATCDSFISTLIKEIAKKI